MESCYGMMEVFMKVFGNKINHLEKGNLLSQMDRFMMVIGCKIKCMDMEFIPIIMEKNMREIGLIIYMKVMEFMYGIIIKSILDNGKPEKKMARDNYTFKTAVILRGRFKTIRFMVQVFIIGKT